MGQLCTINYKKKNSLSRRAHFQRLHVFLAKWWNLFALFVLMSTPLALCLQPPLQNNLIIASSWNWCFVALFTRLEKRGQNQQADCGCCHSPGVGGLCDVTEGQLTEFNVIEAKGAGFTGGLERTAFVFWIFHWHISLLSPAPSTSTSTPAVIIVLQRHLQAFPIHKAGITSRSLCASHLIVSPALLNRTLSSRCSSGGQTLKTDKWTRVLSWPSSSRCKSEGVARCQTVWVRRSSLCLLTRTLTPSPAGFCAVNNMTLHSIKSPEWRPRTGKPAGSDANWPALTVWLMPFSQIKQQRQRESTPINCDEGEAISPMLFLCLP